ncbi:MAG: hypothetical protein JWM85_1599 [Acidimicrobiaceae bacterium]|nr:hypothetical protein [Acidimicrobiaceae bacterium]
MVLTPEGRLIRVPGRRDVASWVAGAQQPKQLRPTVLIQALVGLGEQSPAAIERVGLSAPVAERLVLHTAPALVQLLVRELHDMKGIGHLDGVGNNGVEHRPIGAREVERRELDPVKEGLTLALEPGFRRFAAPAGNDVEELATTDVDDRCREVLTVERALADKEHFVEPERAHLTDAIRMLDERLAIGEHGVVHGVPVAAELACDLVHAASAPPDLLGDPPTGTISHGKAWRSNPRILLGEAGLRAVRLRAAPASLVPEQRRRPSKARKIDQGDHPLVLQLSEHTALGTTGTRAAALDMDLEHRAVDDSEHVHVRQADEDLAHARGVLLNQPVPVASASHAVRLAGLPARVADPVPPSDPKRQLSLHVADLLELSERSGEPFVLPTVGERREMTLPRPSKLRRPCGVSEHRQHRVALSELLGRLTVRDPGRRHHPSVWGVPSWRVDEVANHCWR